MKTLKDKQLLRSSKVFVSNGRISNTVILFKYKEVNGNPVSNGESEACVLPAYFGSERYS